MTIQEIRKSRGLTQEEVSKASGVNRSTYANIENGRRLPSPKVAKRIAVVLGISWTQFYDEEGEEHDD